MDEINDFFTMSSNFKRISVPSGHVNARHISKPESYRDVPKRKVLGTDYGDQYKEAELEEMMKFCDIDATQSLRLQTNNQSTIDDAESEYGTVAEADIDIVYQRYSFSRKLPRLPIVEMKDEILKTIYENRVVVLEGSTGCGKTTQVPQFILDEGFKTGKSVNIVVTQPRRIAAVSIAKRVSKERNLPDLPHLIGYQVGLIAQIHEDTRITYVTTGVLLEKLIATKTMQNYTHIILDEVHERSQDMDFLFIVIRKLMKNSPNVKIILMSATIQATDFAEYFKLPRNGALELAPIIKVDKKSNFEVSEYYLDDLTLLNITTTSLNIAEPNIDDNMYHTAVKLLYVANRIDAGENLTLSNKPTILIFLPGLYEIACMAKHIEQSSKNLNHDDFIVLPLHSMLSPEEQSAAFRSPTEGKRNILLATNIAESSITVPNVKYVIDFCLAKALVTDSITNFTSLQLEWCSKNNCRQRAGRTGRTMDGRVYRLVPKSFYNSQMEETNRPEILRAPLENVVLKAKQLQMGPPHSVLSLAMDRPKLSDIQNTILLLKETGALLRICDGVYSDYDGDLTFIGHVMAALPVDIHIAKLIILGHCFSLLSECIIIGAGLTTKSIFVQAFRNALASYSKKLRWADGSGSDLFAILKAYRSYANRKENYDGSMKDWTGRYFLNEKSLIEMSNLIAELTYRLSRLGINERKGVNRAKWNTAEMSIILKVIIAGSFYPNYFVRTSDESQDRAAYRVINGRNPCNTVYFSGFDEKYIRPLYAQSIKNVLKQCTNSPDNMHVTFEEGNQKVYVTFKQNSASIAANADAELDFVEYVPGQVCTEVYKALKLKKMRSTVIRVMDPEDAKAYAEEQKFDQWNKGKWESNQQSRKNIELVCLPRKHVKEVTGRITEYNTDFNRFWFRSEDEEFLFENIQRDLNHLNRNIEAFENFADVGVGQVVAAPYDSFYYRAKVLLVIRGSRDVFYRVMFMDIGLEAEVEFSLLRRLRGGSAKYIDLPPRVFECRLSCLQPSELHSARCGWGSTMKKFKQLTSGYVMCAKIFSVENGVASVTIIVNKRSVNDILIQEGYARCADENFMSKVDHDLRVRTQTKMSIEYEEKCDEIVDDIRRMMGVEDEFQVPEPNTSRRHIEIRLNGPKSPLEGRLYSSFLYKQTQSIEIEPNSVNSILLDANPQNIFEKCVVAASVTKNQNGSTLTVRETTIMPNIPGFGPLMALIFSPHCEFFRDPEKSRFTAILCGLGENPNTKESLYAERDLLFNLDTELDTTDIENINKIRYSMDTLLQMNPGQNRTNITNYDQNTLTIGIKNAIIELLEKERSLIGVYYNNDVGWSKYDANDMCIAQDVYGDSAIFPFHNILTLSAENSPERLMGVQTLTANNEQLHYLSSTELSMLRPVKCLLCNVDLTNISDLKIHLHARLHLDREKRISFQHKSAAK